MIQRNPSARDYTSCPLIPHLVSRKCLQRSNTSLRTHSRFLFSEKLLPRNEGKGKYYLHIVLTEQTDNLTHQYDAIASCFVSSLSSSSSQQDSNVSCLRSKHSHLITTGSCPSVFNTSVLFGQNFSSPPACLLAHNSTTSKHHVYSCAHSKLSGPSPPHSL